MEQKALFAAALFFTILCSEAQDTSYFEINIGRSLHGTNDLPGFFYGTSFNQTILPELYWSIGIEATLNDDADNPLVYQGPNGDTVDGTLHFVTNGLQLIGGLKYNFLNSKHHKTGVSVHPFVRYQATSTNDISSILFPIATEIPVPVRIIENTSSAKTYAFGASARFHYDYHFESQWFLGIFGGFQTDTNGDTLVHANFKIGRSF